MFDKLRERIIYSMLPDRIKAQAIRQEIHPFDLLSFNMSGMPIYPELTVKKATREGYKLSVYVYRAVRTIVQAASGIPWYVERNGEPVENHPFTQTWSHPNREFSGQDNMEFLIAHLKLVGNALIQPVMVGGKPKEFWVCMPDMVKPIPSKIAGQWLEGWEVQGIEGRIEKVPPEQFIHFMQFDPGNPYWGIGDLQAAARTVDTDNEAQDTQKVQLQNRNVPPGVFQFDQSLNDEQFEEASKRVREKFLQKSKRGEPWVLGGGYKWQQMSLTPKEMDYLASRVQNLRAIAGAFGLSPYFLGEADQTYANAAEARKALYEDCIIPLLDDIKSTLNLRIAPMYGNDITIVYDLSKVAALREDFGKKTEQAKSLWAMGVPFEQINTKLALGFEEFDGWDNSYLPFTLAPAGSSALSGESEPMKMLTKVHPHGTHKCYCPNCEKVIEVGEDVKCNLQKCPDCGALMRAVEVGEGRSRSKALNLTTEEQKSIHWKRIDKRRAAWWNVVQKRILPLYDNESKAVVKAIAGKPTDQLEKAARIAIQGQRAQWEKTINATSLVLIDDFGNEIADDLGGGKSLNPSERKWTFDPVSAGIRAWATKHAAESVTSILATNLEDVARVINAGIEDGLSVTQIGSKLRTFYVDRSPYKAMRVARTEITRAAGYGQRESAKQSGVVEKKQWVSSRDDRVRDEHAALDGQTRKLDEPYSNGEMYPGEDSINCRCTEAYLT